MEAATHTMVTDSVAALLHPERVDGLVRHIPPMRTGFDPLDSSLEGGVQPEELMVVAGLPGVGKTIALVQWCRQMAADGHVVALASYEHRALTIVTQLLAIEVGELVDGDVSMSIDARRAIGEVAAGRMPWQQAIDGDSLIAEAATQLSRYAARLQLLNIEALRGGFDALEAAGSTGIDALFVDHLQKVPATSGDHHHAIAAQLKTLAVDQQIAVVAASPIGNAGLSTRRIMLQHIRDAAAVTHEADIVIVLNDKLSAVSRSHSSFDSLRAKSFRRQTVLSIEKHRRGLSGVDLEFERDFGHRRFSPVGKFVTDTLVDGVLVVE